MRINTVTGSIGTDELGRTLIHEHVLIATPGWFMDARRPAFQRREAIERAVDAFQQLHAYGVRTVVDPCPVDLGRDVEMYEEVSRKTGIRLIAATGAYTEAQGIPHTLRSMSEEEIADSFIREIEDGVGDTGIRCGIIKVATGRGQVTDYERKVISAATRAAKATGVPILAHTDGCTCGHEQIDIVTGGGLSSSSLIVGHSCDQDVPDYQRSLAERGAYVGFDRFGLEIEVTDAVRARNLAALAQAGHQERILVSHDAVACWKGRAGKVEPEVLEAAHPNWRMTHFFENVIPELRRLGMSDADFTDITVTNPRRYFEEAHRHAYAG
ncbi:phosphotriesterase family protein [Sphingobium tyrosinilyticum]|uniref:Phosphotriesterase n=1 Tax=Sphingobium tyrosinilyticum TaxID=2715436 RepID=A0ABV9F1F4_9SPHN